MMLRAIPPENAEKPLKGATNHIYVIMPMTIDGVPCRTTTQSLTIWAIFPSPFSERYIPAEMPKGIDRTLERTMRKRVPMIAF